MDELIVGVLNNNSKTPLFTPEERVEMIRESVADMPNVKVMAFDGLLVDFAKQHKALFVVRGLRAVTDFEYELQLAQTNRELYSKVDTVFLVTSIQYSYLSSSIVKQVAKENGDIQKFVTPYVANKLKNIYNN